MAQSKYLDEIGLQHYSNLIKSLPDESTLEYDVSSNSFKIKASGITSDCILDGAITSSKIASGSINSDLLHSDIKKIINPNWTVLWEGSSTNSDIPIPSIDLYSRFRVTFSYGSNTSKATVEDFYIINANTTGGYRNFYITPVIIMNKYSDEYGVDGPVGLSFYIEPNVGIKPGSSTYGWCHYNTSSISPISIYIYKIEGA